MGAPTELDLSVAPDWRSVPMPGANLPFDLVRLDSPRDRFTVHGRFPAGFFRSEPGGYAVCEEFLVLEGELELEDLICRRGDLTVIPAGHLRRAMASPQGCRVLAWFGGPAVFLPPSELEGTDEEIVSRSVLDAADVSLSSPIGAWAVGATPAGDRPVETIDSALSTWRRGPDLVAGAGDLTRRER